MRIRDDRLGWPKRDRFLHFYREVKGYHGSVERRWPALELGRAVPYQIARGFVEYMRDVRGWEVEMEAVCLPARADEPPDDGAWHDMQSVVHSLTNRFEDRDEMYPANPYKDVDSAARDIVHCLGYKLAEPGQPTDDYACLARGQASMRRTVADYAQWLLGMYRREFHSIMFPVALAGRTPTRVGTSVILPIGKEAYRRLCGGEIDDQELTPDDVQNPSKYIFINALDDPAVVPEVSAREKTEAQVHCMFYQVAYFTRNLRPLRPVLLTIASNPHFGERLHRHGYREIGTCLRGTDFPIVVLRHPKEATRSLKVWMSYELVIFILRLYQIANRRQWREEDRRGG